MMPLVYIFASMRAALKDVVAAARNEDWESFWASIAQLSALISELELHDDAREKVAAND